MPRPHAMDPVHYGESDGRPMGETDLHRDWMIRILDILRLRYRAQQVYVASDLLVYYEEGDPKRFVVPDVFVVLDCDPGRRRVFKTWEEGRVPSFVVEVTSRSTQREDETVKPRTYARLGIPEYMLYDPTGDYLDPPLQGFRRISGHYQRMVPDRQGALVAHTLAIAFQLAGSQLVMRDAPSGQLLLTEAEASEEGRRAAEARVVELEAELTRLRRQLDNPPES